MTPEDRLAPNLEILGIWARARLSAHSAPPANERIELLTAREALGFTREPLAESLKMSVSLIRAWESGHCAIPAGVRLNMTRLKAYTTALASALAVYLIKHGEVRPLGVYPRDSELPDTHLVEVPPSPTARWWRVVSYRAAGKVSGTRIMEASTHGD